MDFIRRAEKVTSFNLATKDFESTKYKKEIQYLINKNFFPDFDVKQTIDSVNPAVLNNLISQLKREQGGSMFAKLHGYPLKGVGPGEATLFFLINEAKLGGGSSAGVDLIVGSDKYEVKAVKVSTDRIASDFKVGGTVPLSDIMLALNSLREKLKLGGSKTEMAGSIIAQMKEKDPSAFAAIEKSFADITYEKYFKNHEIIFINNTPGARLGYIEAVKQVNKSDIMIERVTSGTIKPKVKL